MITHLLILCFINIITCIFTPIPTGASFNLSNTPYSYYIGGTFCVEAPPLLPKSCSNTTFIVLDPVNNRMMVNASTGSGGIFIMLNNATYIYNLPQNASCFRVYNFTYNDEVTAFSDAIAFSGSFSDGFSMFGGLTRESGACNHKMAVSFRLFNNVIYEWYTPQNVPVAGICLNVKSWFIFNPLTIRVNQNFDSYFVIPNNCLGNTPDYCLDLQYPPGNPCIENP